MPYIEIKPVMTEDKKGVKEGSEIPGHFWTLKNYIPKAGIIETRKGVTEFTFS